MEGFRYSNISASILVNGRRLLQIRGYDLSYSLATFRVL